MFNYVIPAEAAKQPDHRANLDLHNPQAQSLIAALAKRQVNVAPTLVVFRNMIYLNDLEEIYNQPDLAHVPRRMLDYWHSYRRVVICPWRPAKHGRRKSGNTRS